MCIATIETVILTLETLETSKIEFLGVHGRPVLLLMYIFKMHIAMAAAARHACCMAVHVHAARATRGGAH